MTAPASDILLVDDDETVRSMAAAVLRAEGYEVRGVGSGMEAFAELAAKRPDLLLLDVVMPGISGLEVLDHVRTHYPQVPVIFLSSLGSDENIVRGLRLGAEDYVVKPFSPRVLVARVENALRRNGPAPSSEIIHGELRLNAESRQVWVEDKPVELTAKEFDLLFFLAQHPGRVYTRRQLLVEVWQSSSEWQQEATVTEHVRRVRQKLADRSAAAASHLGTVRGVGYRFERRARPGMDSPPA